MILQFSKIQDPRGDLTFIEGCKHISFQIQRVSYLYEFRGGEFRAGNALNASRQFLIAAMVNFAVLTDNGEERRGFHLNRSSYGVYHPPMNWWEIENFSSESACLVLAPELYGECATYMDQPAFLDTAAQLWGLQ